MKKSLMDPAAIRKTIREIVKGCVDACETQKATVSIQGSIIIGGDFDVERDRSAGVGAKADGPVVSGGVNLGKAEVMGDLRTERKISGDGDALIEIQFETGSLNHDG
jgi:hypothetical protein